MIKPLLIFLLLSPQLLLAEVLELNYEGFTVWLDCEKRGAWLQTEEITECYRDIEDLLVIGGVIWGKGIKFVKSHGVKTPDAKRKKLDEYLLAIAEIEDLTGEEIPVSDYVKHEKPNRSWMIPRGCDKG